ncbi:TetR/AcrR family transcriptional regulator [Nocardia brasiliensis]|uniref:TetR/AcrR family transcriptional regulator n=1 Tax=Nocardia brasiliensis TaxID=37326 RepID=UPI00189358A6|nr:TetR/AcrR family transcriptional regulator [Nocardia brasiliensis]MBF6128260.1 TetR/AcrR family transcriptional regulator [Nocardia brasiliensis]
MKPPASMRTHRRRGGGQRWREHNSNRQAQILEAAVALIEDNDPHVEVSIQQIAERAGLARSVVYRQFDNRDDLDSRVREYILEKYVAEVEAVLVLDPAKTLEQIIFEAMRTVVHWAAAHPKLYQYGQSGSVHGHAAGETSLTIGRHRVAETLWEKFAAGSALLGIEVAEYRPVVYGVVGLVEGIVTQYIGTPAAERPDQETIARLLTASAWHLYAGHAADRGYHFERTATIAETFAAVLAARAD